MKYIQKEVGEMLVFTIKLKTGIHTISIMDIIQHKNKISLEKTLNNRCIQ